MSKTAKSQLWNLVVTRLLKWMCKLLQTYMLSRILNEDKLK